MVYKTNNKFGLFAGCFIGLVYLVFYGGFQGMGRCGNYPTISSKTSVVTKSGEMYAYDRHSPIAFIAGVPRSGLTLMKAILDAHPSMQCGEENRALPGILHMQENWMRSTKESMRLEEAGINGHVLDSALSSFILEVLARQVEPAPRLCNKNPFTLSSGKYLKQLFPNGKFLLMVRDGRALVHSIITGNVAMPGFDLKSYRKSLTTWNAQIKSMNDQCNELGEERCLKVPYEQLVLHPRKWMEKILEFLELTWAEDVLHHEKQFIESNGMNLSKLERSSAQVVKPINSEALTRWVGHIPEDVVAEMGDVAPMLAKMGYDPHGNPPAYGRADVDEIIDWK